MRQKSEIGKSDRRVFFGQLFVGFVIFPIAIIGVGMILDGIFPPFGVTPTTSYYLLSFLGGGALLGGSLAVAAFISRKLARSKNEKESGRKDNHT